MSDARAIIPCTACGARWPAAILSNSGRCPQCVLEGRPTPDEVWASLSPAAKLAWVESMQPDEH